MPVPSFLLIESFVWPPPPAPAQAPALKKPKEKPRSKKKSAKRRSAVSVQVRTILIDRLEAAISDGRIQLNDEDLECESLDLTLAELALLQLILIPEEYLEPRRRSRRGALSAPASAERIADYRARAERDLALWSDEDATAHGAHERGVKIVQRKNGSGVKVVGWAEEG